MTERERERERGGGGYDMQSDLCWYRRWIFLTAFFTWWFFFFCSPIVPHVDRNI